MLICGADISKHSTFFLGLVLWICIVLIAADPDPDLSFLYDADPDPVSDWHDNADPHADGSYPEFYAC